MQFDAKKNYYFFSKISGFFLSHITYMNTHMGHIKWIDRSISMWIVLANIAFIYIWINFEIVRPLAWNESVKIYVAESNPFILINKKEINIHMKFRNKRKNKEKRNSSINNFIWIIVCLHWKKNLKKIE